MKTKTNWKVLTLTFVLGLSVPFTGFGMQDGPPLKRVEETEIVSAQPRAEESLQLAPKSEQNLAPQHSEVGKAPANRRNERMSTIY